MFPIEENAKAVLQEIINLFIQIPLNKVFVLAVSAQIFSMLTKTLIKSIKNRKVSFKDMTNYGGMPSSHTVFVMAVVFGIGFDQNFGWKHPLFCLAFVSAVVVLIDAVRLRGAVDKLNGILQKAAKNQPELEKQVVFPKYIAHTGPEVVAGIIFALVYTALFNIFFYHL